MPRTKKEPKLTANGAPVEYRVICISLYHDDIKKLDEKVDMLKARGIHRANRSALIRFALAQVDLRMYPQSV